MFSILEQKILSLHYPWILFPCSSLSTVQMRSPMVGRFSLPFKGSFPSILKAITFFLFFFFWNWGFVSEYYEFCMWFFFINPVWDLISTFNLQAQRKCISYLVFIFFNLFSFLQLFPLPPVITSALWHKFP